MNNILIFGAGKIGSIIAKMLLWTGDFRIVICDWDQNRLDSLSASIKKHSFSQNFSAIKNVNEISDKPQAVISALPFKENISVGEYAAQMGISYFDLTEDILITERIHKMAEKAIEGQIYMPQCGLAPGYVGIAAHSLAKEFDSLEQIKIRCGALPKFPNNRLKYNITWSSDGLINEYIMPCEAVQNGKLTVLSPMEGLEHLVIDGDEYEAFNTSGGLGSLCKTLEGKVKELDYKSIRYLGHRDLMDFLLSDMGLKNDRGMLKRIMEKALPLIDEDVVIVFIAVNGYKNGQFIQKTHVKKVYASLHAGGTEKWTAIQKTTAAGICAAVDMHFAGQLPKKGFVRQEEISLEALLSNRFGNYYLIADRP